MKESLWDKDGLLFKFNYAYTSIKPEEIISNRCRLFWRTVILSPLFWFGVCFFIVIMYGLIVPIFFLFGFRFAVLKEDNQDLMLVPYKKWPTILGHRIL